MNTVDAKRELLSVCWLAGMSHGEALDVFAREFGVTNGKLANALVGSVYENRQVGLAWPDEINAMLLRSLARGGFYPVLVKS